MRLDPFAFDGLKTLLTVDLIDILLPKLVGATTERLVPRGVVAVHTIAIPGDEGITTPMTLLSDRSLYNLRNVLVIVVPSAAVDLVEQQVLVGLPPARPADRAPTTTAWAGPSPSFALRPGPGRRKTLPLGTWGELAGGGELTGVETQASWTSAGAALRRGCAALGTGLPLGRKCDTISPVTTRYTTRPCIPARCRFQRTGVRLTIRGEGG